jgi:co-chaperonin GroES (HSP10)
MKVEIKNDTVKIKYINKYENKELCKRYSSILLPESSNYWEQDIINQGGVSPMLLGEVVEIGTRKLNNGVLFTPTNFKIGDKVIFMVSNQIVYKDDEQLYYIVGLGNLIAVIED